MKISYVTSTYNWDSPSQSRCAYEALVLRGMDVDLFFEKKPEIYRNEQIWLMSSNLKLTEEEFRSTKSFVAAFNLSNPLNLELDKIKTSHLLFTNDYQTSKTHALCWFPASCDIRYHKYLNLPKEYDVMTFGLNPHPVSGDRAAVVEKLRNKGVSVHVFGVGWPEHPDNHPFISGPDLIKEINKARVVLDISSPLASFPRRIFEGACCGTTVLTQYREEIPMFFDPDEILTYTNYDNLIDKTIEYLHDYKTKYAIGLMGMRRCIYEHNVTQRIEKVLLRIGQRMSWRAE